MKKISTKTVDRGSKIVYFFQTIRIEELILCFDFQGQACCHFWTKKMVNSRV